jgi:hypothetical protein
MTPDQSRTLKIGQRVYWHSDGADSGVVVARDWSGVEIRWENGKRSFYHHNDMREVTHAQTVS